MTTEKRDLENDGIFSNVIERGKAECFLGDKDGVDRLIRMFLDDLLQTIGTSDAAGDAFVLAGRMSRILLGKNKEYLPLRKWNEEGGIDKFLKVWAGTEETTPPSIVRHAVLRLFDEFLDLLEYVGGNPVLPEQWVWQADAIVEKYANLFLGISPADEAAMVLMEERRR